MRGLLFRMGPGLYALRLSHIVEVLPLALVRQVPGADAAVAGLLNLRGQSVPVVDLALHCLRRAEPEGLRTRIVLLPRVNSASAASAVHGGDAAGTMGLVLHTTGDILDASEADIQPCPLATRELPFMSGLTQLQGESVQWIDPGLLAASLVHMLRAKGVTHA